MAPATSLYRTAGQLGRILPLVAILLCGCHSVKVFDPHAKHVAPSFVAGVTTNAIDPDWLRRPTDPFRLGPGDRIEVESFGQGASRELVLVCPDGKIYYDLLPGLNVWGLTLDETKALLEQQLSVYMKKPQLTITLREVKSRRVWVLGRVEHPGIYPMMGAMTVLEAVACAAGPASVRSTGTTEEIADLRHSFLVREGRMLPVNFQKLLNEGDTTQNIYVHPDDYIYLPSSLSQEIYVMGAVGNPRRMGFVNDMTVGTAIAKGGGPRAGAYLSHVAIVRGSLIDPQIAIVDFAAILDGKQPDVTLEPHDVIYVPDSPYATLGRYTRMIVDMFVRTIAVNEAGHASSSKFSGVSVSNPIK